MNYKNVDNNAERILDGNKLTESLTTVIGIPCRSALLLMFNPCICRVPEVCKEELLAQKYPLSKAYIRIRHINVTEPIRIAYSNNTHTVGYSEKAA